jgi:hypothetical protein
VKSLEYNFGNFISYSALPETFKIKTHILSQSVLTVQYLSIEKSSLKMRRISTNVLSYVKFFYIINGAKCLWGKMSVGRNILGLKCLWGKMFADEVSWGELFMGRVVHGASCPWGELSMGRVVHGASYLWGELSIGRVVHGQVVHGVSCQWSEMTVGRNVMGRVWMG